MIHQQSIGLVIPALNESASIAKVLAEVPKAIDYIVVVDNGSEDDTAVLAERSGALVIREDRKGYGSACLAGINFLEKNFRPDLIAFMDADYSDYPADLSKVIEPVAQGKAAFGIGYRMPDNCVSDDRGIHQRLGNWFACVLISLLYGVRYLDLGPMRCIRSDTLNSLQMTDIDFGWTTEMQVKIALKRLAIEQVPVRYRHRLGESKISGTIKGSISAAAKILFWSVRARFQS